MGTLGSRVILKVSQSLTDWRRKANVARSDVLSISRLCLRAHSQGHRTIDRLEKSGTEKQVANDDLPLKRELARIISKQRSEIYQRHLLGNKCLSDRRRVSSERGCGFLVRPACFRCVCALCGMEVSELNAAHRPAGRATVKH